jgi:hypothetical protein
MEIKIGSKQMLKFLLVVSYIIFIGLCIEAGGFIFNAIYSAAFDGINTKKFWQLIDLSELYTFDKGHFYVQVFIVILVAVLKAILFFLIIKVLQDKKLDLSNPFNREIRSLIFFLSYVALGIGFFSRMGIKYVTHMVQNGVNMPDTEQLRLGGYDVWLFMGVILFVIGHIYKRGIELQTENDLTI